jgi:hypothetical protein
MSMFVFHMTKQRELHSVTLSERRRVVLSLTVDSVRGPSLTTLRALIGGTTTFWLQPLITPCIIEGDETSTQNNVHRYLLVPTHIPDLVLCGEGKCHCHRFIDSTPIVGVIPTCRITVRLVAGHLGIVRTWTFPGVPSRPSNFEGQLGTILRQSCPNS